MVRVPIAGAVALVLLSSAGCTATPPTITPPPATEDVAATETALANAEKLQVEVLNTEVAVGFERVAFRILDASGVPIPTSTTVEGVFQRVSEINEQQRVGQRVASGNSVYFGAELPGGGSWVVYTEIDASGPWWLDVNASREDGWTGVGRAEIEVIARSTMPRVGDPPATTDTPKLAAGLTLADLTSDPEPLEVLYSQSLADAKTGGQGAVVLFASGSHCDDPACASTLAQLKRAQATVGSKAAFIHVETRDRDDPTQPSAAAKAWGLVGEPWTFVISPRGFVGARVQGEFSATEMQLLLDKVLEP